MGRGRQGGSGAAGGLTMYTEAVQAGVLLVAPVTEDTQLHRMIHGTVSALKEDGGGRSIVKS